ncbi:MAG: hypothetical protein DWQ19_12680 [Crenarchaeota archaeon]|nr:MAG: hypothetical protein DWQ19_12680 [Thermoproteota archaeon]
MARKWSHFRIVSAFLKKTAGTKYPIYIRRVKLPDGFDGTCEFRTTPKKCFLILINRKLSEAYSIDVAIHEVAHAMSWGKEKDFHGPKWGIAYSKIYRKYLKEFHE